MGHRYVCRPDDQVSMLWHDTRTMIRPSWGWDGHALLGYPSEVGWIMPSREARTSSPSPPPHHRREVKTERERLRRIDTEREEMGRELHQQRQEERRQKLMTREIEALKAQLVLAESTARGRVQQEEADGRLWLALTQYRRAVFSRNKNGRTKRKADIPRVSHRTQEAVAAARQSELSTKAEADEPIGL